MVVIWSNCRVELCQAQSLSIEVFTIFKDGYFTTPLNSLFQCLTALLLKKFSLIPNKNFPCFHLCLIQTPCIFKKKSSCIFFITSHQVAEDNKCLLRLLQMETHSSLSPSYIMYSTPIHLWRSFTGLMPACQCQSSIKKLWTGIAQSDKVTAPSNKMFL